MNQFRLPTKEMSFTVIRSDVVNGKNKSNDDAARDDVEMKVVEAGGLSFTVSVPDQPIS
jgi:hypothetical protein